MQDIQNLKGEYGYKINKVGVTNLVHPMAIKSKEGIVINTVGNFSMSVSLEKDLRGINMSRLPIILSELSKDSFTFSNIKVDLKNILNEMKEKMQSLDAFLEIKFDFFRNKKAPLSGFQGLMPYKCCIVGTLEKSDETSIQDTVVTVEVPVTTLCPCSKAISDYSAHNQRGYVSVSIRYENEMYIEDIIDLVESVGSCEIYPILKREDEKFVTEKAYENPRFVEDIVRMVANNLYENENIKWFKVSSIHQESIHAHDAFAVIEVKK